MLTLQKNRYYLSSLNDVVFGPMYEAGEDNEWTCDATDMSWYGNGSPFEGEHQYLLICEVIVCKLSQEGGQFQLHPHLPSEPEGEEE
jgi:hypothetical protein